MQISMKDRGYSRHVYSVLLENDEERSWCHYRIITATDRRGELSEEEWQMISDGDAHPGHFGGKVERVGGSIDELIVTVNVD